jgi:hypothetical protein
MPKVVTLLGKRQGRLAYEKEAKDQILRRDTNVLINIVFFAEITDCTRKARAKRRTKVDLHCDKST